MSDNIWEELVYIWVVILRMFFFQFCLFTFLTIVINPLRILYNMFRQHWRPNASRIPHSGPTSLYPNFMVHFQFFKCFFSPWKCVFVCFCMWVSACDCLWLSSEARRGELQYPLELKFSLEPKFPVELKFQVIEIKLIRVLGSMLEPSTREKVQLIVKPSLQQSLDVLVNHSWNPIRAVHL